MELQRCRKLLNALQRVNFYNSGSEGFIKTQYGTIASLSVLTSIFIMITYFTRTVHDDQLHKLMSNYAIGFFSGFSFLLGAVFSAFSGYAGIWISVRANVRVASAARNCYNNALQIAFKGGYFAAVINVALAILGQIL